MQSSERATGDPSAVSAEPSFTPGPWRVCQHEGGQWFGNIVSFGLGKDEYGTQRIRTIDCLRRGAPEAELLATAHLIAAAPEMYAALEGIEALVQSVAASKDAVLELTRAALAKARGQA